MEVCSTVRNGVEGIFHAVRSECATQCKRGKTNYLPSLPKDSITLMCLRVKALESPNAQCVLPPDALACLSGGIFLHKHLENSARREGVVSVS